MIGQPQLTDREAEVLDCAARGLSEKETARELDISAFTVKAYRRTLRAKLGAEGWRSAVYRLAGVDVPGARLLAKDRLTIR